jgi:hypothetical protein
MKDITSNPRSETMRRKMFDAIRAAVARLKDGKPQSGVLQKRLANTGHISINQKTVCLEADKSRSALHRHYPELLDEIETAGGRKTRQSATSQSTQALSEANAKQVKLREERNKLATRNAYLEFQILELRSQLKHEKAKLRRRMSETEKRYDN